MRQITFIRRSKFIVTTSQTWLKGIVEQTKLQIVDGRGETRRNTIKLHLKLAAPN